MLITCASCKERIAKTELKPVGLCPKCNTHHRKEPITELLTREIKKRPTGISSTNLGRLVMNHEGGYTLTELDAGLTELRASGLAFCINRIWRLRNGL